MIQRVPTVAGVPKPQASYSTYTRFGDLIFVAGQVGVEPETGRIPFSFADQLKLVLDHIRNILESAGYHVTAVVDDVGVVSGAAEHLVCPASSIQRVVAGQTVQDVGSRVAGQSVARRVASADVRAAAGQHELLDVDTKRVGDR